METPGASKKRKRRRPSPGPYEVLTVWAFFGQPTAKSLSSSDVDGSRSDEDWCRALVHWSWSKDLTARTIIARELRLRRAFLDGNTGYLVEISWFRVFLAELVAQIEALPLYRWLEYDSIAVEDRVPIPTKADQRKVRAALRSPARKTLTRLREEARRAELSRR